MEATPIPGTILVNVGDLLQIWTAGKFIATVSIARMGEVHGLLHLFSLVKFLFGVVYGTNNTGNTQEMIYMS